MSYEFRSQAVLCTWAPEPLGQNMWPIQPSLEKLARPTSSKLGEFYNEHSCLQPQTLQVPPFQDAFAHALPEFSIPLGSNPEIKKQHAPPSENPSSGVCEMTFIQDSMMQPRLYLKDVCLHFTRASLVHNLCSAGSRALGGRIVQQDFTAPLDCPA